MLVVFFDIYKVVHIEFVPSGQTFNEYWVNSDVLRLLRETIHGKCGMMATQLSDSAHTEQKASVRKYFTDL